MDKASSILDVANEEFANDNKPLQQQEPSSLFDIVESESKDQQKDTSSLLDVAENEFIVEKEIDPVKLKEFKQSGQKINEKQERAIFDYEDQKPVTDELIAAASAFIPAAAQSFSDIAVGGYELGKEAIVKPVIVGAKYHLGLATAKDTQEAAKSAGNALRSLASGVASDVEETASAATRLFMYGSTLTDKLQGLPADERYKRYRLREDMRTIEQSFIEGTPDRAAALLSENPILKKITNVATKMQGGTEEDAKEAERIYSELVLESGLTKDELNERISKFGEFVSPLSIPGANLATKTIGKVIEKAVQKGGKAALKGIVKPVAKGVRKTAEFIETAAEKSQDISKNIGEYLTGDPDTLIKNSVNTIVLPIKKPASWTGKAAGVIEDVANQVDVGGAAGRRGLFERAGRAAESGDFTKVLFSPESMGGLGRARAADWLTRQSNAIIQQGVNGSALNVMMGLPDIESGEQLGQVAGSGFGIGAVSGSRIMERLGAAIDPRTGLAQKIDTIITPNPASFRTDEDADIKRFLSTVDPDLVPRMEQLANIDARKKAIQDKIDNLNKQKDVTFGPEVQNLDLRIENYNKQLEALNKSTPETQKEILRQVHLAFADQMDAARTTGKAAGLNNIQVKILDPAEMDGFFRNLYGTTLTNAEQVIASLTGNPNLTPQETENLANARLVVDQFYNEVGSAQAARGLAISDVNESNGEPVPEFMRKQNLEGATVLINGDLVKQLSNEGFNLQNTIGHEIQHALSNFKEVREMLAPIRQELFDQKIKNEDGSLTTVTKGIYSDDKLDAFADVYAAAMSPSDNGASFKSQFNDNIENLRAYIKDEILSEITGRSGNILGGNRAALDSVGRSVVDWIEVKTKSGALKTVKEALRKAGIIVDDSGDVSTILGAELTPESLAMVRQYQRQLRDMNQSMVYDNERLKENVEIPLTKILSDRALQERFKDSDVFQKEQVVTMTAPDGNKTELPIPDDAGVDPFVGTYRVKNGQIVDESGNPMVLGTKVTFGNLPDGTEVQVGTRIARNIDGSPKILSNREIEARSRDRGKIIRNAIDSAIQKGITQLEDTGNGNYRGVMSEQQVAAVLALPNSIVAPNLKRQILFVNELLRRKDGTRMEMEYQAAMRGGKSRALSPQIKNEIPIGFQFSKQGNFLITTMSVSRMNDKVNAWLAKKPENLKLWNGDTGKFWDDVIKVLDNHSKGDVGQKGLDEDPAIALDKKHAVNDLFNVWNAETKAANPRRTKLPPVKGKDPQDVIVRSRRIDRINQYFESPLQKMPFNYELAARNYMPAENPLADFQTPEEFANLLPSVTSEQIKSAIDSGNTDLLELNLRDSDDLKPGESLDVDNGKIRIVSMFDPQYMPEESVDYIDQPQTEMQFMPERIDPYVRMEGEVPVRKDWDEMLNKSLKMSYDEFVSLAKKGKFIQATGEKNPFVAGTGETPLSYGAGAGYSLEDIVHFYSVRTAPMDAAYNNFLDNAEFEKISKKGVKMSYDEFISSTKKGVQFMPERMEGEVPTQETLDAMKARLPKYKTQIIDSSEKNENRFKINIRNDKNEIVGFVTGNIDPVENRTNIEQTVVYPDFQKQGYGEALYREIAKYSQSKGIDAIFGEEVSDKAEKVRKKLFPTTLERNGVEGENAMESQIDQNIRFMPAETERYPTFERGMYSGLQKTIDEKVQGKFASPDQLKAIVTNPQNVKAEELKWSGVLGEIDRLAQENNGKVPKDKVMEYLRNEGAVKFEEVTLGGTTKTWTQDEIDALEREARRTRNWDAYEQAVLEFEDQQLGSDANSTGNLTKYAQYQLPGGENYREVVMTMPIQAKNNAEQRAMDALDSAYETLKNKIGKEYWTNSEALSLAPEEFKAFKDAAKKAEEIKKQNQEIQEATPYTSSHFPDVPNYIAHARVNDRVDAQGRKGRFIEEIQSDRHQAGREQGYSEKLVPEFELLKNGIFEDHFKTKEDAEYELKRREQIFPERTGQYSIQESNVFKTQEGIPDAPFRKDWPLQIFKRQLRDAVDSGEEWIGWTTGIEQVRRYEDDLRKQVKSIEWTTKDGLTVVDVKPTNGKRIYLPVKDGKIYRTADQQSLVGKSLSEVIGKEATSKVIETPSGKLTGDDLTIGGEGMKGFYDQILPKEIGKYVAKMGGKVEKSEIDQSEAQYKVNRDSQPLPYRLEFSDSPEVLARFATANEAWAEAEKRSQTPIWKVNITPEMAGKVKGGQLQFMPEQPTEYEPISARIRPLQGISAPTKMVGAKAPVLGEIEPPVRGKAMLPDMELKPTIGEKPQSSPKIDTEKLKVSIDQPFDEFGDIDYDAEDAVRKIAKDRNLGITRDRELAFVAKDENGEIVGGAFTSADQDGYTFDVVVSKEAEGKGVGSKLLDEVINPPSEITEAYPDAKVKVDVVNPSMKKMLENRGFVVEEKIGKERWIMVPKKPDISEKGIQSSDIITSAKPAPDAVIKLYSNALVSSAGLINFLPAYHGTPHEIPIEEGFKMSQVGTGEGAQAYGHGLYFAQAKGVAEGYRKMLSKGVMPTLDKQLPEIGNHISQEAFSFLKGYEDIDSAIKGLRDTANNAPEYIKKAWEGREDKLNELNKKYNEAADWIESNKDRLELNRSEGNLYKVDIDVKDEDLLDWDGNNLRDTDDLGSGKINNSISKKILGWESIKSIEDFEQKLKEAETEFAYGGETGFYNLAMDDARQNNLPDVVDYWAGAYVNGSATGERIYNYLAATTSPKAASEYLNSIGIPGIRYLDGTSRKQGEGTYNYVIFDENLIKILDKNDKPVEGDLPKQAPLTGLQFMPASPVTKTQTGYDYTYLDEALKNGKNGKVALTRPVRADEALPLLSQRIPITNQVDRNSFDYLSPAEVEFYQYENNPVSFKFDPALLKKPVFKDAAVEHAGKNVQLAMADRQTASGGDMGGIMFPWLKSNIDSTVIGDDGIEYRAVWGNQEWKPVLSMKNKNKKFNSYNLLTYLMGPDAHASNTRQVRVISNEIENSNISRKQKDLFLMLANIGVKNQKRADQRDNINEANKDIDKTNKLIEESSDPQEIKKLNKVIKQRENDIVLANIKYNQFLENPNEELIKSVITKYKTAYTRFKNKTGSESNFIKNKKALDDFKKTTSFKDLLKTIKNKQLISLDYTFKGRKASVAQILGLTIDDFNVDNILDQTMDFKNGRINHIVGSIELSRNPDLMAVYLGDDPDQAKRMTVQESKAAAQLKANPNFVPHEAYAWAMLGPVNGNHFLNSNPKTHLEYFPDFKEAYASIQDSEDKKQKIREGNETTLMGAMRDNTQMALAMPKISDKK